MLSPAHAATPSGVSEFFVPVDEDNEFYILDALGGLTSQDLHSVVSLTSWADNTVVYYDHWENGYNFDPNDPGATADESCSVNRGAILNFESSVPLPRLPTPGNCTGQTHPAGCTIGASGNTNYCYDGRDRVYAVGGGVTMVRSGWPENTGAVTGLGEEVYPVKPQLTTYILPFGEDLYDNDSARVDYRRVFAMVQATRDGTLLQVDFDHDGTYDPIDCNHDGSTDGTSCTLDMGDTYRLDRDSDGSADPYGHLDSGTVIKGSDTLQLQIINGDSAATYNSRAVSAFPRGFWGKEYYAPVPSSGRNTDILLYNPNAAAITVNWTTTTGSGSFSVGANQTVFFGSPQGAGIYVPSDSGVYLQGSDTFWAISDIDTNSSTYDWSYSLVPSYFLDQEQYLSWAPGCDGCVNGSTPPAGDADDGGMFITAAQDNTTVFVDRDNNGTVDYQYTLNRLETQYIYDAIDGDLTGAHIWATAPYTLAYGENPQTAPTANPGLDVGYTTLPNPGNWMDLALTVAKATNPVSLSTTANPAITTYTLTVQSHEFALDTVSVVDTLAADWHYAIGTDTTTITLPDGSTLGTDPALSGASCGSDGGSCTLTWSGLGSIGPNQTLTIVFSARTVGTPNYASGALSRNDVQATATRAVGGITQTFTANDFAFNAYLDSSVGMTVTKSSSVPQSTPVSPGDTITYTVAVSNPASSTASLTGVSIYDPTPNGVSYVTGSGQLSGPVDRTFQDGFGTQVYDNQSDNTGGVLWGTDWVEQGDDGSPTGGDLQIVTDGGDSRLRVRDDNNRIGRRADLSGSSQAILSFDYRRAGIGGNADEYVAVQVCQSSTSTDNCSSGWVEVTRFRNGTDFGYTTTSYDLNAPSILNGNANSATFAMRLYTPPGGMSNGDTVYFDDVKIDLGAQVVTNPAGEPPLFASGYTLAPGQTLTLTLDVAVDSPLPTGLGEILNTASATANEIPVPISDEARNIIVNPSQQSATVGDRVWLDGNGNGVLDVGEGGLAGVQVTLKDQYGAPMQVTSTDSQGRYSFGGVALGYGYYVEATGGLPGGLTQTTDGRTDNRTAAFDLYQSSDLGNNRDNFGTVAYDNSDGSVSWSANSWSESGDNGLAGSGNIQITGGELRMTNQNGGAVNSLRRALAVPSAATGATLSFDYRSAGGLEPEDEVALEISDDGGASWTSLATYVQFVSGSASFDIGSYLASATVVRFSTNNQYLGGDEYFYIDNLDISYGESEPVLTYLDADIGYHAASNTAVIGDLVWSDADGDGVRDPGEPGLAGVAVRLYTDINGDGLINVGETFVETTTAADGSYLFNVAASGTEDYIAHIDTAQSALSAYGPTTGTSISFGNVADGGTYLTADFGFAQDASGTTYTIVDRIWLDDGAGGGTADDGGQNGGESGIGGVTVALLDASGNVIATTTSDASGDFRFSGVPGGARYSWQITDQYGVLAGYYATTSYAQSKVFQMPGTLSGDLDYGSAAHFGYDITRSIGDTVFNDSGSGGGTAGDGIQDGGEPGISGVAVLLYQDADNDGSFEPGTDDGSPAGSIITDPNGKYIFSGLASGGHYWVNIDDTQVALGGYDALTTGDDSAVSGHQRLVILSGEASRLDIDYGYRATTSYSLSGRVWDDSGAGGGTAGNGVQDPGEPGLGNVTVELAQGGVAIGTTTTLGDGSYGFDGLPAGTAPNDYTVRITDDNGVLAGYGTTYEKTEMAGAASYDGQETVTVPLSAAVSDLDFGYYKPIPTLALVRSMAAHTVSGQVVVRWQVASELGTAGYYLERLAEGSGAYVAVNLEMVPGLVQAPRGAEYWLADPGARPGGHYRYRLVEVESDNVHRVHGPYEVVVDGEGSLPSLDAPASQALQASGYARRAEAPSAEDVATWRSRATQRLAASPRPSQRYVAGQAYLRIEVREAGLYRVAVSDIASALGISGAEVTTELQLGSLALSNEGQAVAYRLAADASALYFYGEGINTLYSDTNVYLLGRGQGVHIAAVRGPPLPEPDPNPQSFLAYTRWEQNLVPATYLTGYPDEDYWFWGMVRAGAAPLVLSGLDAPGAVGAGLTSVTLNLRGGSEASSPPALPDHHLQVLLNGVQIGATHWDGTAWHSYTASFQQGVAGAPVVLPSGNTIELRGVLDPGVSQGFFWLDSVELSYYRGYEALDDALTLNTEAYPEVTVRGFSDPDVLVLDIDDPRRPVELAASVLATGAVYGASFAPPRPNGQYLAVALSAAKAPASLAVASEGNLLHRNNRADYLVIAPYALHAGAEALAELRAGEGLRTQVVDLQDIYDELNFGIVDAHAIRDFLGYAYHNWAQPPAYVVLAGKGTIDPRDFLGYHTNVLPVLLADSPFGLNSSDNRYADVVGNDGVPEMAIGRIPVLSDAELQSYVQKLSATALESPGQDPLAWQNRAIMIADGVPDPAGDFQADSESVIDLLPGGMSAERHYYLKGSSSAVQAQFRAALQAAISTGAGLVNYIGHGSINQLGTVGVLTNADVATLTNASRLPVLAALTCAAGWDSYPGVDALAGKLVLHSGGGAAAVLAPSGLSYDDWAVALNAAFVEAAYAAPGVRIGDAVHQALAALSTAGGPRFMIDMYGLTGDPAVEIPLGTR